jgi:hypothetical protein
MPKPTKQQIGLKSMQDAASGKDIDTFLPSNRAPLGQLPQPQQRIIGDSGDTTKDYARAMEVIKRNNPLQTEDPMMELLRRRLQPKSEFQTDMSDKEAADMDQQFAPTEEEKKQLELKRKLLNNLNNQ